MLSPRSARSSSSRQDAILRCASASGIVGHESAKSALAPTTTMMRSSGMFLRSSVARVPSSMPGVLTPGTDFFALTGHPELDILQTRFVRDVIDEDGGERTSVKERRQRAEAFLASSVPELQVDFGVLNDELLRQQARADCRRPSGTKATGC